MDEMRHNGNIKIEHGVAVENTGNALKVHAGDSPHLVSLGGDRFSTAVTVHPIPNEGRVSIGCGKNVDILIIGTGVHDLHCWIENVSQVVTLYPNCENILIDGQNATQPTRLRQGCMLCLGRSNFLRFNHPVEAKFMKAVLPNTRISMMPNVFYPNDTDNDSLRLNKNYESCDSWCDVTSETSSDDLLSTPNGYYKYISPKVFPAGSATLNSPASVVLGQRYSSMSIVNNNKSYTDSFSHNNMNGIDEENKCGVGNDNEMVKSTESLTRRQRITTPTPAFDRNPSYMTRMSPTSPLSPNFTSSPTFINGKSTYGKLTWSGSPSSLISEYNGYLSDSSSCKSDIGNKQKQVHKNKVKELEKERMERLRLEEILTLCTEYEVQAQIDRSNKSHVRIKTNGSLPRDKCKMLSPRDVPDSPTSSRNGCSFTYNKIGQLDIHKNNSDEKNTNNENTSVCNSPRPRIRTVPSKDPVSKEQTPEIMENKMAILQNYELIEINNNSKNKKLNFHDIQNDKIITNNDLPFVKNNVKNIVSSIDAKYKFLGIDRSSLSNINHDQEITIQERNLLNNYHNRETDIISCDDESFMSNSSNKELVSMNGDDNKNSLKNKKLLYKNKDLEKLNGLVSQLNEIVKETRLSLTLTSCKNNKINGSWSGALNESGISNVPVVNSTKYNSLKYIDTMKYANTSASQSQSISSSMISHSNSSNDSKFILPLEEISTALRRQSYVVKKADLKKLQDEENKILIEINRIKSKLIDIQQQKDEIIRELEMEKALVEGELKSESEKLKEEENAISDVQTKINNCEKEAEYYSVKQKERQSQNKKIINEQKSIIESLQEKSTIAENGDVSDLLENIKMEQEILDDEIKNFEDFEFGLLEEKAILLSKRDDLQMDLNESSNALEDVRARITELYCQKEQLLQNASDDIKALEVQVRSLTSKLQQNHSRLQDIKKQHLETSQALEEIISSSKGSNCDENLVYSRTQSQEDLDRISRVTSDAPLMKSGSSNSLGRRTIESLQEIERNRQLHLAQQGSHVIEEERKRVLALKRRVQDEVKAQWESKRNEKETSIYSIASDDSSVISCDRTTESADEEAKIVSTGDSTSVEGTLDESSITVDLGTNTGKREEDRQRRHSSNCSQSHCTAVTAKLRSDKSNSSLQRPESHYSLYRRGSLDLRQHIESAGHQVAHCPHVIVDKTTCKGYLHKMTSRFRTWNKRWFVFDKKNCSFSYYSDKNEKKFKGGAHFQNIVDLYIDNRNSIRSSNPHATFIVKSTERTYYLLAPSIEAMRIWFDVLATEVDAYLES